MGLLNVNPNKTVTPINFATYATIDLIPKPFEHDNAGLLLANTVKNRTSDNVDIFVRVQANSITYKLIVFYPDNVNGAWYYHPDHEVTGTTVAIGVNAGRKWNRFLASDAVWGCHYGLYLTAGVPGDIAEASIIPCRRAFGGQ